MSNEQTKTTTVYDFEAGEKMLQLCIDNYNNVYRKVMPALPEWKDLSDDQRAAMQFKIGGG